MAAHPSGAHPASIASSVILMALEQACGLQPGVVVVRAKFLVLLVRPDAAGNIAPVGAALARSRCWRPGHLARFSLVHCPPLPLGRISPGGPSISLMSTAMSLMGAWMQAAM